ncbi:MAG: hypothetical protein AAB954_02455 [Patescibacteria group bacterium]
MKNVPFIIKIAIKPVLVLVLLIVFSFIGFSKAFSQVKNLKEELAKAVKNENILKSKLDILSADEGNLQTNSNSAVSYFPGENPTLLTLYQLRKNAVSAGLFPSNLKVNPGGQDTNGFMKTSIIFDVQGTLSQILDFVGLVKIVSPNIWIENTELDFQGETLKATIATKSYWAPYPVKIPALTEPVSQLDASEKEILTKIAAFNQPPFVSLTSEVPRENLDPFGEEIIRPD